MPDGPGPIRRASRGLAAGLLAAALALTGCLDEGGDALERGDELLSRGEAEAALAEYRLALRQKGDDPAVLLRIAHAHAVRGDVDASVEHYLTLVERDSAYRYQAASDLSDAARRALDRGREDRMARALEPVMEMGVQLMPPDLREELARHYFDRQDFERALTLYLSFLAEGVAGENGDGATPVIHYRTARAYEELGGCENALGHFEAYLESVASGDPMLPRARWHYGSCLYQVAQSRWRAGEGEEALELLEHMIDLGSPRTLMDRAQYLRGELLLDAGEPDAALTAFREVLRLNPARSGPLVHMAEEKIREIRYDYEGQ